jgi:hypothetical protein
VAPGSGGSGGGEAPSGGGEAPCAVGGACSDAAPLGSAADAWPPPPPPPPRGAGAAAGEAAAVLPADAGAPWRARRALALAFAASGGAAGAWAPALAAAWAARLAGGEPPCAPAAPPWPGVACDAAGRVAGLALRGAGLRGGALRWLSGDAFPALRSADLALNPALGWCEGAQGAAAPCDPRDAHEHALLPPSLEAIDLTGTGVVGPLPAAALARGAPALRAILLYGTSANVSAEERDALAQRGVAVEL